MIISTQGLTAYQCNKYSIEKSLTNAFIVMLKCCEEIRNKINLLMNNNKYTDKAY